MVAKLLIANRGEIACRVMRTARRMGLRTVAVYSEADARAMHVQAADEAYLIGPPPAAESYLNGERIIDVARRAGADAVHPGYGFLSENAGFAMGCAEAGITFVGPPPAAIEAMGGKSAAKALLGAAGVPLVPGYHGDDQADGRLFAEAETIGFPVLIKASAGGGGKGMRVVEEAAGFDEQLAGARRESTAAFGDATMLVEKYLARPRHVEIQVLADAHGTCLHLFERDCSIQRRHQKVVEEAPAPGLDHTTRRAMGEAAVAAANAIGYVNAGTCEFLLDEDGAFYFMEMNTRLQVEHAVTEYITGLDLVEWQLRIAAGERLPFAQDQLAVDGHAIEARLYAEDPARSFLPSTGVLRHLSLPADSLHMRVDTGVGRGDAITIHYDPMIAKLVVWDRDRAAAVGRLRRALEESHILGVASNLDFLSAIARHPAFAAADLDTRFIDRHAADLLPSAQPASDETLALATLGVLAQRRRGSAERAPQSGDPFSPWHLANGWRLNDEAQEHLTFRDAGERITVVVHYRRDSSYRLDLPGGQVSATAEIGEDGRLDVELDGVRRPATVVRHGLELAVLTNGGTHRLSLVDPVAEAEAVEAAGGRLTAPMPGKVVGVLVEAGQAVEKGTPMIVLEAMKMEHTVVAPTDGTVTDLPFSAGEQVEEGVELIGFQPA